MNVSAISSQVPTADDQTIAPSAEDTAYRAKVQQAAEQFESFFISQMLRQMRSATKEIAGEDSIYGKNTNSDMLDYADTSVADVMSRQRAFGIADVIVRQLLPTNNKV